MDLRRAVRIVRIERHQLGPRLFVHRFRVHEWHAGAALIAAAAIVPAARLSPIGLLTALVGLWLVIKDWNDLFPSRRDTAAWRMAPHRPPRPLRPERRGDWLPPLAGLMVGVAGLLNVSSALTPVGRLASGLTPDPHGRAYVLVHLLGEAIPRAAHAFALPAGAVLLVVAVQLAQRRRRAWGLAVVTLALAGVLNLLKGLDVAEALACWTLAGVLVAARPAFCVGPRSGPADAALRAAVVVVASFGVAFATLFAVSHWATPATTPARALEELIARAAWAAGPLHYRSPFQWIPHGIDAVLLCALIGVAWVVFRPLAHPRDFPGATARRLASAIVRQHGHDTLSSFKLRRDKHYFFSSDRRAFVGYGLEGRHLVVSGDPVGPAGALPALIHELYAFAEMRGLKLSCVGASAGFAELARRAGLRSFYIGDEAMVDAAKFSLEGRKIRKVRQSVTRAEREGYAAALLEVGSLDDAERARFQALAEEWRGDDVERGFSMAIEGVDADHLDDSLLLVVTDGDGEPRGLLHFVRCYGRAAVSLGLMRRDRDAPNGLTEFMVVRAIEGLRDRGIEEVSLNFAPFARLIHSPASAPERLLGRLAVMADRFFQVERLYRFNSKFQPHWEPRYILYEGLLGLPRAGLAVMWAEGQLPKPRLARRAREL
jgi:lysyl-tRNA synthetase class 2